jgi:hypothetical protein
VISSLTGWWVPSKSSSLTASAASVRKSYPVTSDDSGWISPFVAV